MVCMSSLVKSAVLCISTAVYLACVYISLCMPRAVSGVYHFACQEPCLVYDRALVYIVFT